ncbi:MAG TPA: flagellar export chaperone FliS [bacterium]
MTQTGYKAVKNSYLAQQIQLASPEKLILMMYDLGLKSCRTKDRGKASKVLVELISALNFDYKDASVRFFELYRYALDRVQSGKFEEAGTVLQGLRDAWQSAFKIKNQG